MRYAVKAAAPEALVQGDRKAQSQPHHSVKPARVLLGAAGVAAMAMAVGFLTAPQTACNDGSTGCCIMCTGTCACGDSCEPCGQVCTKVQGCACSGARAALRGATPDASSD